MNHVEQLKALDACPEAVDWAATQPDWDACWANCPSGEWMLWALAATGTTERELAEARCDIVDTVLHLVPEGEDRPRIANEVRRKWGRGEATDEELAEATAMAMAAEAAEAAEATAMAAAAAEAADAWAAAAWAMAAMAASATMWAARAEAASEEEEAAAAAEAARARAEAVAANERHATIVRGYFPAAPALGEVTL